MPERTPCPKCGFEPNDGIELRHIRTGAITWICECPDHGEYVWDGATGKARPMPRTRPWHWLSYRTGRINAWALRRTAPHLWGIADITGPIHLWVCNRAAAEFDGKLF